MTQLTRMRILPHFFRYLLLCLLCFPAQVQAQSFEVGADLTGTHLHKIDEAPVGVGGRLLVNLTDGFALDAEVARYPGKTSVLAGIKSGIRLDRFGVFGKSRFGMWHFNRSYFAVDIGGVVEYYPSPHTALRIDAGDAIIFYGGVQLGTVHNFQPGIGFSYRF